MQNESIDHLIISSLTGELSAEEQVVLASWISDSSENEEYYKYMIRTWELSAKIKPEYSPDTEKLWRDLLMKIELEPRTGRVLSLFRGSSLFKIAASILLVVGLGYLLNALSTEVLKEIQTKQTTANMDIFYLPDSSVVWLNKNSTLTFPSEFDTDERVVYLDGEAFFDIKKNPAQPFIIHAGGSTTKVLGTSFDLSAYRDNEEVRLTVLTGKVSFSSGHQTVILLPQESARYIKSNKDIVLSNNVAFKEEEVNWIKNEVASKKSDVYAMEKKYPQKYLHNTFGFRSNLINQTVIEGVIENQAKICSYTTIYMKAVYESNKKKEYEHHFVLKGNLAPGQQMSFKEKLPDWFVGAKGVKLYIEGVEDIKF